MTGTERDPKLPADASSRADIDAFLQKVAATPPTKPAGRPGRLLFAIDATAIGIHPTKRVLGFGITGSRSNAVQGNGAIRAARNAFTVFQTCALTHQCSRLPGLDCGADIVIDDDAIHERMGATAGDAYQ